MALIVVQIANWYCVINWDLNRRHRTICIKKTKLRGVYSHPSGRGATLTTSGMTCGSPLGQLRGVCSHPSGRRAIPTTSGVTRRPPPMGGGGGKPLPPPLGVASPHPLMWLPFYFLFFIFYLINLLTQIWYD